MPLIGNVYAQMYPILKEHYAPKVTEQLNAGNVLLNELGFNEEANSKIQTTSTGGKFTVMPMRTGFNRGAGPRSELAEMPLPGADSFADARINLTRQHATGAITGFAQAVSDDESDAFVSAIVNATESTKRAMKNSLARQIWGYKHGAFTRVATSGVSGSGPWTLTLADIDGPAGGPTSGPSQAIVGLFVMPGDRLQFVTISAGVASVKYSGAQVDVTGVSESGNTITVETVSGTPAPAAGDYIVMYDTANECLSGLCELMDQSSVYQEIDRSQSQYSFFRGVRSGNGGTARTATFDLLQEWGNKIARYSGDGEFPDMLLSRAGVSRTLYNEAGAAVRYEANSDGIMNITKGNGTSIMFGNKKVKLLNAFEAPAGRIFGVSKEHLFKVQTSSGYSWREGLQVSRRNQTEMWMSAFLQLASDMPHASGSFDDVNSISVD